MKKRNSTIFTFFFPTQLHEHPKDLIYKDTKCNMRKCIKTVRCFATHWLFGRNVVVLS